MRRWEGKELLEDGTLDAAVARRSYAELAWLQRRLGNVNAIMERLRSDPKPVRRVLDIGCGHGAMLEEIRRELGVEVVGYDLGPVPEDAPVRIVQGDATKDPLPEADVAFAVCMVHHLSPEEVAALIRNAARSCRRLILLDLVRHRLPLFLFQVFVRPWLAEINGDDGVTSIRRAYTPAELGEIAFAATKGTGARVEQAVARFQVRQIVDISW